MPEVTAATRLTLALALVASATACARPYAAPVAPSPQEIPQLEADVARRPGDADLAASLGAAYREADRLDDARAILEATVESHPDNQAAVYFLGLTLEEAGADSTALTLYRRYLDSGSDPQLREELRRRTELLRRRILRENIQASLAREASLANTPPQPRTVAVFPFPYLGSDESLRPLGRALSEMLAVDLSQTNRLSILERSQIGYLMDEIALGQSGRVDPATAARGGRILGAERVVEGQIDGTEQAFVMDAAVVQTQSAAAEPVPLTAQEQLTGFFDLEKQLALDLYQSMGIQLTPAERERVTQRRTENLEAVLAFGLGLEAQDAGRYEEARGDFQRAVAADPTFGLASDALDQTNDLAEAAGMGVEALSDMGYDRLFASGEYAEWLHRQNDFIDIEGLLPGTSQRDAASELMRRERLSPSSALLEVILRRPGGTP